MMGEAEDRSFSLRTPRDYRGRVGAVIPGGGIILPQAKNPPAGPVTYALSGLTSGLTFDPAKRSIEGSPISVHATNELTYSATDASTPAVVLTRTFQFPIVGSTSATTLDDWDNRGYGLSTRRTLLVALLQSGANVGPNDANTDIFVYPPRGTTGSLVAPTVLDDLEIPGLAQTPIITRIRLHPLSDRMTLNHSNIDADGNPAAIGLSAWRDAFADVRSWWLQWRDDADEYPVTTGDSAGGSFLRVGTSADSLQSSLDDGQDFIVALTDTA